MASTDAYCDNSVRYLTIEDLTELNAVLIAAQTPHEPVGVLQPDTLASAQQSPAQYRYYEQTTDIIMLAAVLGHSLAEGHAFCNANKRTAAAAATMFLLMNGVECTAPSEDLVEIMRRLVNKECSRYQLASWLRYWCRPFDAAALNQEAC